MRENTLLENISKLNTFVHMTKSNEFLELYIEKIMNNRSKNLKFINDFDHISLDLLYTSLQIMSSNAKVTKEDIQKLDKNELKHYLDKIKGIGFFKSQVPALKDNESLISYLTEALANGAYICNNNNTVKFDNGLIVDSDWIVEFAHFLVTSFNNNVNLSPDGMNYVFNNVTVPKINTNNARNFIKEIKLYEYNVSKKGNQKLTYDNVKYLINTFAEVDDYDFKKLQDINSKLAKEGYILSINKKTPIFKNPDKLKLEKLLNEEEPIEVTREFIKDALVCYNSKTKINRRKLIEVYELLLSLSHAYKCAYSLDECRKLFDLKEHREAIRSALAMANFYINYIYDEANLNKYFNYALLKLDRLKPNIIDYETPEYKEIIKELSSLNKKSVVINRKINKYLFNARRLSSDNQKQIEDNKISLDRNCKELEKTVKEIKMLREQLDEEKDENRRASNINKTKIKYVKDSLIAGTYTYDKDTSLITFDVYSNKDYHRAFNLEISLEEFIETFLSDHNRNLRINFYQI
jgi:hypothetical protein